MFKAIFNILHVNEMNSSRIFFTPFGSIDISCRVESDEIITSYFCKQMCRTDRYFKDDIRRRWSRSASDRITRKEDFITNCIRARRQLPSSHAELTPTVRQNGCKKAIVLWTLSEHLRSRPIDIHPERTANCNNYKRNWIMETHCNNQFLAKESL